MYINEPFLNREAHQQSIAAQERMRAYRLHAQSIETLRERNNNITPVSYFLL